MIRAPFKLKINKRLFIELLKIKDWSIVTYVSITIEELIYSNSFLINENDIFYINNLKFNKHLLNFFNRLYIMDYKIFIHLCIKIANEPLFENCKFYIEALKKYKKINVIDEWRVNKKMKRLLLRIYPLLMKDKEWYSNLIHDMQNEWRGECLIIKDYYGLDL